jgi:hypothetical protein
MCFSRTGTGRARMWVATDHAALLRDTEGHFSGMRQHYLYRVTSLQIGPVPLSATRYAPPVRTRTSAWLQTAVIGGGDSGWFSGWPETWRTGMLYRAPPPHDSRGRQYTEDGVSIRRDTLTPIPSTIGVLYYLPKPSVLPLMPPAQYRGSGPYVYLQERIQVRGLPAALRHGRALRRGHCTVWAGSYGKGAPWVVLARQNLALLASTNALTQQDLLRYAFASLC